MYGILLVAAWYEISVQICLYPIAERCVYFDTMC
jgi:hypothetical protein